MTPYQFLHINETKKIHITEDNLIVDGQKETV